METKQGGGVDTRAIKFGPITDLKITIGGNGGSPDMETNDRLEYRECDTCSKKPGSPILCGGCLNNRSAIEQRDKIINEMYYKMQIIETLITKI